MGDWDDEANADIVAQKLSSRWDEEEADAIPDSWDAEVTKPVQPKQAVPPPTKLSLSERIKQREEQRRKEKEEKLKREEEARAQQPMTEIEREKLAEESEIGLLKDTFGLVAAPVDAKDSIDSCDPQTKEDFNKLNSLLKSKLMQLEKSPHYSAFADQLIRDAITEMEVDVLKSLSTTITALVAEKQKLIKSKTKKKGKGKLVVERDNDYDYGDEVPADEYDDFM